MEVAVSRAGALKVQRLNSLHLICIPEYIRGPEFVVVEDIARLDGFEGDKSRRALVDAEGKLNAAGSLVPRLGARA